jgi:hypothetical protein
LNRRERKRGDDEQEWENPRMDDGISSRESTRAESFARAKKCLLDLAPDLVAKSEEGFVSFPFFSKIDAPFHFSALFFLLLLQTLAFSFA